MSTLDQATIVILARNCNPSIVSSEWLSSKGIVIGPLQNFVHTPVFSMVETGSIQLIVDEARLQLILKQPERDNLELLRSTARLFVESLPETPYTAVGLNLRFTVPSSSLNLDILVAPKPRNLRRLFGKEYQVGSRIEFQYVGFRVRAEIPVQGPRTDIAQIAFNFHADAEGSAQVIERINQHQSVLTRAEAVVAGVTENG